MTSTESKPPRPRNATLEALSAAFPVFRDGQPLAIGIHKEIRKRLPDITPQQLRDAMRSHTASTRYLKALAKAETRFDLDGAAAGEVSAEQRQQAVDTLRERQKKSAERHKAAQAEQREAQKEALLAQQRQEKLARLADKFNAR